MQRRLFNFLCALSCALSLATLLLWARSHFWADSLALPSPNPPQTIKSISYQGFHPNTLLIDSLSGRIRFMLVQIRFGRISWRDTSAAPRSPDQPDPRLIHLPVHSSSAADLWNLDYHTSAPPAHATLGFSWTHSHAMHFYSYDPFYALTIPHWFPALLFAILPALRLRQLLLHRHRISRGLCPTCGYDLRATPNRCPECGASTPFPRGQPTND